jgi:hypothetical protein
MGRVASGRVAFVETFLDPLPPKESGFAWAILPTTESVVIDIDRRAGDPDELGILVATAK